VQEGRQASAVAKLLIEFGQRTALRGGNPYRTRAYTRPAESLLALTVPLAEIVAQDRLREIPGVGEPSLHRTGTHLALEGHAQGHLRPDKVLKVHRELGVASLEELEQAARQDRLRAIKGLGPALQCKIPRTLRSCRLIKSVEASK
jgi:DNA polymerase (family 10)